MKNKNCPPVFGGILGCVWFLLIWGESTLDTTNVDWLKQGDCATHFFGWLYFKNSAWQLPLGIIDGLTEPYPLSVIYTDSIPLFAVLFKILSPALPSIFQYFGIWGLFSLMMEGVLAFAIIKYYDGNAFLQIVIGSLIILQPCMIGRMFSHTALAGQWIILLAIYIWINKSFFSSFKRKIIAWSITMMLACSIHMYFIPMVAIIMLGSMLDDVLHDVRKTGQSIVIYIGACFAGIIVLFLLGAMSGNVEIGASGLGYYCMNLNSLWNPMQWSKIFPEIAMAIEGQYEGFAYLGAGVITAICMIAFLQIYKVCRIHMKSENRKVSIKWKDGIPLFIVVFLLLILAMGTVISINDLILFTWSYPHLLDSILGIFRSSGRMIWPVCYLIVIGIACYFIKKVKNKRLIYGVLTVCLILQIYDLSGKLVSIHVSTDNSNEIVYRGLEETIWNQISNNGLKHIYFCDNISDMKPLVNYAAENGMTVNDFHASRKNVQAIYAYKEKTVEQLKAGWAQDDYVYVFEEYPSDIENTDLPIYGGDGYYVVLKNYLDNIKEFSDKEIFEENNFALYMEKVRQLENCVVLITVRDEASNGLSEQQVEAMQRLGLMDFRGHFRESYICVIDNGKIVEQMNGKDILNYQIEIDDKVFCLTSVGGDGNKQGVQCNGEEYSVQKRGFNVVVYDMQKHAVIDSVAFDTFDDGKASRVNN